MADGSWRCAPVRAWLSARWRAAVTVGCGRGRSPVQMNAAMMTIAATLMMTARWRPGSRIGRLAAIALRIGAPMVLLTCSVMVVRPVARPWSKSGSPEVAATV